MPVPESVTKPLKWLAGAAVGMVQMFLGLFFWLFQVMLEIPLGIIRWLQGHFPGPNEVWNMYCLRDVQDVEPEGLHAGVGPRTTAAPVAAPSGIPQQPVTAAIYAPSEAIAEQMVPVAVGTQPTAHEDMYPTRAPAPDTVPAPGVEPLKPMPTPDIVPDRGTKPIFNERATAVMETDVPDRTYQVSGYKNTVVDESLLPPPIKTAPTKIAHAMEEEYPVVVESEQPY
ncbi:hypothetical protein BDQ17DRAFT_1362917 [Cyathus striatus]|nr:hypothetical protein BDQ17DRAFT_1362917 [Cyathus striatus]